MKQGLKRAGMLLMALLLMLASVQLSPPRTATAANLITNNGFESGFTNWNNTNSSNITVGTSEFRSGSKSARIQGSASWGALQSASIAVTPNTNYAFTYYYKGGAGLRAVVCYDNGSWQEIQADNVTAASNWTQRTIQFNSGSHSSIFVILQDSGNVTGYFDDLNLDVDGAAAPNLLANPGFEMNLQNWASFGTPSVISVSSSEYRSGSKSLRMAGTGSWGSLQSNAIAVNANTNYTLTYYYKGGSGLRVAICYDDGGWKDIQADATLSAAGWTQRTVQFNTGARTSIFIVLQDSTGVTGHFDDLKLAPASGSGGDPGGGGSGGSNATSAVGTNLSEINSYDNHFPFVNMAFNSLGWFTNYPSWGQELSANQLTGTKYLPAGTNGYLAVFWDLKQAISGSYVVKWDGSATVSLDSNGSGSISVTSSAANRIAFNASNIRFLFLRVQNNSSSNPISNIRVTKAADENNTNLFAQSFIDDWKSFKYFRFMDWMTTNSNQSVAGPADYPDPGALINHPVSIDKMVALCNQTNADMWITIPVKASDALVDELAQYAATHLNSGLQVYVELGNEVWNMAGPFVWQQQYAAAEARRLSLSNTGNNWEDAPVWYAWRSEQIHDRFESKLGAARVQNVIAWQTEAWWVNKVLDYYNNYNEGGANAEMMATAPYFGGDLGLAKYESTVQNWTLNDLFQELRYGTKLAGDTELTYIDRSIAKAQEVKATIDNYPGVVYITYEGGQHLTEVNDDGSGENTAITSLFTSANRDARMGDLYTYYLDRWKAIGGRYFTNFSTVGPYSKYGSWAVKESETHTRAQSPKYDKLLSWIVNNPKWW
ncbi:hypothetical protein SY83_10300 [Paenibacillus swuensis]|uniref:CBM-cenC domain-containing protein n=1 Tax=Paenibacillus swuensis TaxID=1178515 RepID=A0A172THR3_9BACL|nr:hypothetical protein [Paenibacillus swuensis]ANE46599.1 hypothetical protein SY83_10300 [Paenibacillus swuensis]